ncbi:MarR family winged helix-turn-helix transcriptional regulator [Clostridium tetanomorphum]|uniref:MarR family winged helix-turn-helix transcriptional regulator n=1 Tax=Clostridium tetanomorphum TaxID=1553 RepID=UPI000D8DC287|nr:MarR family transcriptional regulator [Clostridium tetanomorphum]SQC01138.1 MarR-family transcriptional regulator [Clostridium tetanomorphum]
MNKDTTELIVDILIDNIMFDRLLLNFNLELPKNQSMVLGVLYEEESLPISEIGKKLEISKPQMTVIIDKLIKQDLVERIPDKKDRRVININLTTKGKNIYTKCIYL